MVSVLESQVDFRGLRFMRRGEVNSWRQELPRDLQRTLEDRLGRVMNKLGYLGEAKLNGGD